MVSRETHVAGDSSEAGGLLFSEIVGAGLVSKWRAILTVSVVRSCLRLNAHESSGNDREESVRLTGEGRRMILLSGGSGGRRGGGGRA